MYSFLKAECLDLEGFIWAWMLKVATLHTRRFGHRVKVATLQLTPRFGLSIEMDIEK